MGLRLAAALLSVTLLDELGSGIAPAGASRVALDLGSSPGLLAGWILAGFHVVAFVVEPALLRWAEQRSIRLGLGLGLIGLAITCAASGLSRSALVLVAMLALYGPSSGLAVSVAEGTLVEAAPDRRERTLTWISIAGIVGDVSVPALIAVIGWRASFALAAGLALMLLGVVLTAGAAARPAVIGADEEDAHSDDEHEDDEGEAAPTTATRAVPRLRDAVRNAALVGWTLLATLASMMDEVLTAFLAVYVHARSGDGAEANVAVTLTALTVGELLGLLALDRALSSLSPMRSLVGAAIAAVASLGVILVSDDVIGWTLGAAVLGAAAASFHPITKARCYAALPGHPGVVNAVASLLLPVEIAAPLGLGALASTSPGAALATFLFVPVVLALAALRRIPMERGGER